jgi:hypothetical protein
MRKMTIREEERKRKEDGEEQLQNNFGGTGENRARGGEGLQMKDSRYYIRI